MNLDIKPLNDTELEIKQTTNNNPEDDPENNQDSLVITGPLSDIYTKALLVVHGRKQDTKALESQANDAIMQINIINDLEKAKDSNKKLPYVYVTDTDHIENNTDDTEEKFHDGLKLALDNNKPDAVVIELNKHSLESIGNKILKISNTLKNNNVPVYHSRRYGLIKIYELLKK